MLLALWDTEINLEEERWKIMFNPVKALINKIRYLNRVILSIEKKEDNIISVLSRLMKNLEVFGDELEHIDAILNRSERKLEELDEIYYKVDRLYEHDRINNTYFNMEYLLIKNDPQKKILLAGFYGAINLGDELMMRKVYNDLNSDNIYVLMSDNPELNVFDYPGINILHYPKTKFDYNYLARQFDCLVFGGGAIIDDYEYSSIDSFKYDMGKIFIELSSSFIKSGKAVYSLGLSVNESLSNSDYISKLKSVVDGSKFFSVRDHYSVNVLRKYVDGNIRLINDIVMTYDIPVNKERNSNYVIGIIWICIDEEKEHLLKLLSTIKEVYEREKIEIRFVPFYNYYNCDQKYYQSIVAQFDCSGLNICDMPKDFNEACSLIGSCDLVISMRYHGALLAFMNGCKTIGYLMGKHRHYYNKMTGLFERYNCKEDLFVSIDELCRSFRQNKTVNPLIKQPNFDNSEYYQAINEIHSFFAQNMR